MLQEKRQKGLKRGNEKDVPQFNIEGRFQLRFHENDWEDEEFREMKNVSEDRLRIPAAVAGHVQENSEKLNHFRRWEDLIRRWRRGQHDQPLKMGLGGSQ
ncbi:hypothetical protein H920_07844 [Fukomys damarensis]|uniref:Uncharacterized protein n=1 Tax=Fukomys damarensis TaxID=885580 RepID=A0A091E6L7_FUKDA|nr:hypothetical protein H920_07844 [Fukomys damarensis]